ncbi:DUF5753 domain-containing protein [Streptomyces mirabilis]|uniref:DUF5753 domain-containing protein n=1 Tax=Streptomyces mirabilis TaxID=68239 RepID=UPI0036DF38A5
MNGDRGTSPVLVKALLDCYGVTDPAVREDVLDLVRADQAQRQKWWVITAMRVDLDAKQVEDLVDVRMNRQALLVRDDAPKLWAVIDEAAFRRIESRPNVLKEQLGHLLDAEPRTNITLQLLPFAVGFHPGLYRSFMLMGFPEPSPDLVWVENLTNSVYFEGSDDVGRYVHRG